MKTVVDEGLCIWLAEHGYFYVMHRFDLDSVTFVRDMKARKLLATKGLDILRGDLDLAQARQIEASVALALLPAAPGVAIRPLTTAEHEHEASNETAEAASRQLQDARQALATTASVRDSAKQERDSLQAVLADPRLQAELSAKRLELVEANARETAAEQVATR